MKQSFYIFFLIAILISCDSNTILKKPTNLISKNKMVDILADSYIAKSAKKNVNLNGARNINYNSLIFKIHNIDSLSFNNSLMYYTSDIKQHQEILKQVKSKLQKKVLVVREQLEKEKAASKKENLK